MTLACHRESACFIQKQRWKKEQKVQRKSASSEILVAKVTVVATITITITITNSVLRQTYYLQSKTNFFQKNKISQKVLPWLPQCE